LRQIDDTDDVLLTTGSQRPLATSHDSTPAGPLLKSRLRTDTPRFTKPCHLIGLELGSSVLSAAMLQRDIVATPDGDAVAARRDMERRSGARAPV
jgi:hypothetical protein